MARATSEKQLKRLLDRVWPRHEVTKQGQEHMLSCPFCASHKAKLAVNPGKGVFQCWVCGESGPISKLLLHLYTLKIIKQSDIDAIMLHSSKTTKLSDEIGSYQPPEPPKQEQYWDEVVPCVYPKGVYSLQTQVLLDPMAIKVRKIVVDYLASRHLSAEDIRRYNLAFCSKPDSPYHGHIFFPALGRFGREMVFWTTRASFPNPEPKSLHSGHKYSRFNAKQILFNEHLVADTTVALCEGPFDAHSIMQVMEIPACPLLGKILHPYHVDRLIEKGIKTVYLCLDPDARDFQTKAERPFRRHGIEVRRVELTEGDPNDVTPDKLKTAFEKAVSTPISPLEFTRRFGQ